MIFFHFTNLHSNEYSTVYSDKLSNADEITTYSHVKFCFKLFNIKCVCKRNARNHAKSLQEIIQ